MPIVISEVGIKFVESVLDFTVMYKPCYILLKFEIVKSSRPWKSDSIKCIIISNLDWFKHKCKKQVCSCDITWLLTVSLRDGLFAYLQADWIPDVGYLMFTFLKHGWLWWSLSYYESGEGKQNGASVEEHCC